jgi:hypothetical protein
MPTIEIINVETYNAQTGEVSIEQIENEVPTEQELLLQKQEELLKVYAELELLKQSLNIN